MKTLRVVRAGQFLVLSAVIFLFQTGIFAQTVGGGSIPVITNLPPVSIFSPKEGMTFDTPTNILITAILNDVNWLTNVEFFANGNGLGKGILELGTRGGFSSFTWTNPPAGSYTLTAVASYNDLAWTKTSPPKGYYAVTSAPVNITVSLPVMNFPPVVRMVSPANGAVFHAPVNLPLFAYAVEPDSTDAVASVEFFVGTNSLGFGQPVKPTPILPPTPVQFDANGDTPSNPIVPVRPILPFDLYSFVWSNASAGNYELTAVATGDNGISSTSAPVKIAVLPLLPPPTHRPTVVSIVATDPVAVAGTNSWTWPGETNSPPNWNAWPSAVSRFFTNAGPKTATFTVRRAGGTNDDLTVLYAIGGTASNGVDYVALPGFVTVPAGERAALITIVPIDNVSNRVSSAIKTVVLTLTPSTNTPPDYQIGFPRLAAAVIVDSRHPRPGSGQLPGGSFHLNASGPDAAWFRIEYSTNLLDWTPVCTNQVINGSIDFIDPAAPNHPSRFYRAVPLANAPAD
jgi:hypothetical protein